MLPRCSHGAKHLPGPSGPRDASLGQSARHGERIVSFGQATCGDLLLPSSDELEASMSRGRLLEFGAAVAYMR